MIASTSQKTQILALLRQRGGTGLTALEAMEEAGTMRLAAYVKFLRDDGYPVETEMITTPSGKHVARYRLITNTEDCPCSSSTSASTPEAADALSTAAA